MRSITHIITGLNIGGAERALHNLLAGGLQKYFDNRVISLTGMGHYGPLLVEAGITVASLDMTRPSLATLWRLRQAIRAQQPDLAQGWMYHGNLAASVGRRFGEMGTKLAWNIRCSREGSEQLKGMTNAMVRLGGWVSSGPDAIIYNSVRSLEQHEAEGYASASAEVIPNGFDTAKWYPDPAAAVRLRQELGLAGNVRIIGFVARAHPEKDPANLFQAYMQMAQQFQDCHLVCVGKGLVDIAPPGLDLSRVSFLGERYDIPRIMSGFDLLCLTSQVEGFPNVIGEAMACAVPCVSTDVGDAAMIVGETGWIVPPRNSEALADALLKAIGQPESERALRAKAARQRIIDHYSLPLLVDRYRNLYTKLLGDR